MASVEPRGGGIDGTDFAQGPQIPEVASGVTIRPRRRFRRGKRGERRNQQLRCGRIGVALDQGAKLVGQTTLSRAESTCSRTERPSADLRTAGTVSATLLR
jgi:hypothetical protein